MSTKEREGEAPRGAAEEELAQKAMGDYGKWQLGIILLMCGLKLPIAWVQLGIVFLAAPMPFHCDNGTQTCTTDQGGECHKWVYDRSVFSETIISEWDLVCSRLQLVNVTQMVLMIGILVGNIIFSIAADRFGRKTPLVFAGTVQMLTGVSASFSPWFSVFLVLRFLQAVATGGMMTISFVLCMEVLSGQMRTTVTTLSHIPFNIGHEMMVGIAYFVRDWRHFQLVTSLPSALIITFLWLVPESPRWLLAVGRYDEAMVVLRKAAAVNNNPIPADVTLTKTEKQRIDISEEKKANILDLLRTPNMRSKTLAMSFNWMACGLCFYGLAQYVSTIGGNIFVNVALAGSFVIPGMLITLYTLDKFGRKFTLISGQFLASLCCFLIIFFPEAPGKSDFPRVALASLGILGMGISFPTAYLYSGELFPTVVRNVGVGTGSMSARVGSMVAPFVASLSFYGEMLPPLVFSLVPLAAGILGLLLPETRNTQLPQTLEEGELFGKKHKPPTQSQIEGVKNEAYINDHQA
ncbi:organic cation transporter protein-like isoform X2 [Macrosteles quadrilineatus]|uniref:organic cation transporter protein-like isoform X2 n=1 Tax=Macrosteles quadrilineatus TaxID=74068 RepID=UPI0023E2B6FB|nr:organic cation transporter protein-like isoform X2 [Macrosteles quadrilineatus]